MKHRKKNRHATPSKPRKPTKSRSTPKADLEEISPNTFIIRNPGIRRVIKSEGTIEGSVFKLTSWRKDGLIARLRQQEFIPLTLEDQIDRLPDLPPAPIIGEPYFSPIQSHWRYSHFDTNRLMWVPDEVHKRGDEEGVFLRSGWIVRRRKGRGHPDYFHVYRQRAGGIGFEAIEETRAILSGYAQAAVADDPSFRVRSDGNNYYLPNIVLPTPHHRLMERIGSYEKPEWVFPADVWPLVCKVGERLGVQFEVGKQRRRPRKRPTT
jgi:hypothetical protein